MVMNRKYKYAIVSAVYGVEAYISEFIRSVLPQLNRYNVQLILVNDGTKDKSIKIARELVSGVSRVKIVEKQNGGQASARNFGMDYVDADWVAFMDPDDMISDNYFESIDNYTKVENCKLIVSRFVVYDEATRKRKYTHPLDFRFRKEIEYVDISNPHNFIHMTVNSAFFLYDEIVKSGLLMEERIKPTFEDAHFTNRYLLNVKEGVIAVARKSEYYYRRREDETSTLDTKLTKKEYYDNVIEYGYQSLLDEAQGIYGYIPYWIQRVVLYSMWWRLKELYKSLESHVFIQDFQAREKYIGKLKRVVDRIDSKLVTNFELAGGDDLIKGFIAVLTDRLDALPNRAIVKEVDAREKHIKISILLLRDDSSSISCLVGNNIVERCYQKSIKHSLAGYAELVEYIFWIDVSLEVQDRALTIFLNHRRIPIARGSRFLGDKISVARIFSDKEKIDKHGLPLRHKLFRKFARLPLIRDFYRKAWLFMDRDVVADDNAEHLYDYAKREGVANNSYFVLKSGSKEWNRLKSKGYKLIPYASIRHRLLYLQCRYLISSHVDNYITNFMPRKYYSDFISHDVVSLRHGVLKDDMSSWLNSKYIRYFIVCSRHEREYIVSATSSFKYTDREVKLTGFCRFDHLQRICVERLKKKDYKPGVLIMPTWRKNLAGPLGRGSSKRMYNPYFKKSDFYENWNRFLSGGCVKKLIEDGYRIYFIPHHNLKPYIKDFDFSESIEVVDQESASIQTVMSNVDLLITDYSSVSFDMAYIDKPTIYYQFDRDLFFSGAHSYKKGYYDYNTMGFGPVVERHDELEAAVEDFKKGAIQEKYFSRMTKFFEYKDDKSCERVCNLLLDNE